MAVASRAELKDYCLRRLGFPVIQINVDDDQVEDRISDAFQFFQDYHYDATQLIFIAHRVTAEDIANRYIDMAQISGQGTGTAGSNTIIGLGTNFVSELTANISQVRVNGNTTLTVTSIINNTELTVTPAPTYSFTNLPMTNVTDGDLIMGVNRIFPVSTSSTIGMFDLRYQLRLHELYDFTSTSYVNYILTQQHLRTLEMMFTGENSIRFNRKQNRLYIDVQWGTNIQPNEYIMIEAHKIVDPNQFTAIYDDRFLKRYTTALIKRQWGANLMKFGGMQLPGGIVFNGKELYDDAEKELEKLEEEMQLRWEEPAIFQIG